MNTAIPPEGYGILSDKDTVCRHDLCISHFHLLQDKMVWTSVDLSVGKTIAVALRQNRQVAAFARRGYSITEPDEVWLGEWTDAE